MRKKIYSKDLAVVIVICLLAISSVVSLILSMPSVSGVGIVVGLVYFFRSKKTGNLNRKEVGLNRLDLKKKIKNNCLFILLPILFNILAIILSKLILPNYMNHVISRVEDILTLDRISIVIIQFAVFAFVEELVWRGLVQKEISKHLKPVKAIIVTSVFFSIAHTAAGPLNIIIFDLFFILLNSIVYGLIYYRSKNIYIPSLLHFISNLSGLLILLSLNMFV